MSNERTESFNYTVLCKTNNTYLDYNVNIISQQHSKLNVTVNREFPPCVYIHIHARTSCNYVDFGLKCTIYDNMGKMKLLLPIRRTNAKYCPKKTKCARFQIPYT